MTTDAKPRGVTPSQTVGPFFAYALTPEGEYPLRDLAGGDLATPEAGGEAITLEGRVLDGDGAPVPDAMIEIWQADAAGRYADTRTNSAFRGFGRSRTDAEGRYRFRTVKPGAVGGANGVVQAPHLNLILFARGLLLHLVTRAYFADEPANAADPVLASVPEERRGTLIARGTKGRYTLDLRLQGEDETVFFALPGA